MNRKLLAIALCGALLQSTAAYSHGVHIKEPGVEKGAAEIHDVAVYNHDNEEMNSFGNELEFSYGFTNNFKAEASITSEDHEMEKPDYVMGTGIAAQIGLAPEGEYMPESSVYISYEMDESEMEGPDELGVMGIFGKKIANFDNILNVQLAHETGQTAEGGVALNIGAQSIYKIDHHFGVGAEYFGEFGQIDNMEAFNHQGHQLGPIVHFSPIENAHASIGYLFGVSEHAPDSSAKFELGYEFK